MTADTCSLPQVESVEKLTMLRESGMQVMRLNFSHGSYDEHGVRIANLRESVAKFPLDGRLCAIALDTKAPTSVLASDHLIGSSPATRPPVRHRPPATAPRCCPLLPYRAPRSARASTRRRTPTWSPAT